MGFAGKQFDRSEVIRKAIQGCGGGGWGGVYGAWLRREKGLKKWFCEKAKIATSEVLWEIASIWSFFGGEVLGFPGNDLLALTICLQGFGRPSAGDKRELTGKVPNKGRGGDNRTFRGGFRTARG